MKTDETGNLTPEIAAHYQEGREQHRLSSGTGELERVRTQELLKRFLPPPPAVVLDVGGGGGVYSFWLAGLGYTVHLVDAMPLHIEQAREEIEQPGISAPASLSVGDARHLEFTDASADAVLLIGPLYHLTDLYDRLLALREAFRVLRPNGVVCAVAISRFASALDGMCRGYLFDPEFVPIVEQDLASGQHRNPNNHPTYFTTAFLHHPDDLKAEVNDAGFSVDQVVAIEGPGWMLANFENFWDNSSGREILLRTIRTIESEPSLLGVSAHIMVIGRKNG